MTIITNENILILHREVKKIPYFKTIKNAIDELFLKSFISVLQSLDCVIQEKLMMTSDP